MRLLVAINYLNTFGYSNGYENVSHVLQIFTGHRFPTR